LKLAILQDRLNELVFLSIDSKMFEILD